MLLTNLPPLLSTSRHQMFMEPSNQVEADVFDEVILLIVSSPILPALPTRSCWRWWLTLGLG